MADSIRNPSMIKHSRRFAVDAGSECGMTAFRIAFY